MLRKLLFAIHLLLGIALAQITVQSGSYDSTNAGVRTYTVWYSSSHQISDPTMPIAVYIHGGSWATGDKIDAGLSPATCANTNTDICALAAQGYAVYSIDYTLVVAGNAATQWPVQWQDGECFLKFLAEDAGVSVPGNPNKIHLFGHSAGAQIAGVVGLAPHNAFPTNCGHQSTSYAIVALALLSPIFDMSEIAISSPPGLTNNPPPMGKIYNYLGCSPYLFGTNACFTLAHYADAVTYIGLNQPPTMVETGYSDATVPYYTQTAMRSAYAALSPSITSIWNLYGITGQQFPHNLDLEYTTPCVGPTPCGSAGQGFTDLSNFFSQY